MINSGLFINASLEEKKKDFNTTLTKHSIETRLEAARSMDEFKSNKPKHLEAKKDQPKILFAADGRPLQKNEGKWIFKWTETKKTLTLVVELSKYLDTSLIDLDVQPTHVTMKIKGKILQLTTEEPVSSDNVVCERSKLTGHLSITMAKANYNSIDIEKIRAEERQTAALEIKLNEEARKKAEKEKMLKGRRKYDELFIPTEAVDYKNIIDHSRPKTLKKTDKITQKPVIPGEFIHPEEFVDDPSVPPLC